MKRASSIKRKFLMFVSTIMVLSLWLPFISVQQVFATDSTKAVVDETAETADRSVRFTYIREDQNYGDWNIWAWNTGVTSQ